MSASVLKIGRKIAESYIDTDREPGPLYGCVHIPDFPAQAFIRNEPELRRRPVAVLDGTFPLFTVAATNGFARSAGVQVGMTKLQLEQFPDIEVRYRSSVQEDCTHRALLDCAHYFTPRVEDTSLDTITLDLNGLYELWGSPRAMAQKLFRAADKLGLEAHIAVAPNPDAAMHAARAEAGITVIADGEEQKKLESLPLHILSPDKEIQTTLDGWGLETFGDLTHLPKIEVAERLGQEGVGLWQMARGGTTRPLHAPEEKPCFKESMELEDSIDSNEPLIFILSRLLNQLCQRLTARNRTTNELRLTLLTEPRAIATGHIRSSDPRAIATGNPRSTDPAPGTVATGNSFVRTINLPIPIRDPKILLKLFQLDLDTHRPPAPVVEVSITAEPVKPRTIQNGLFLPLAPEPEKLELTLARIGSIVGAENVGSPELIDTHRPDAFRIQHFNPLRKSAETPVMAKTEGPTAPMALRVFRPSIRATVEMRQGQPDYIRFGNKAGKVIAAAGPWNSSGDWWRDDTWNREEWDIELRSGRQHALYRIYLDRRTGAWFVDGTYD